VHAVLSGQQTHLLPDPVSLSPLAVALDHEADISNLMYLPSEKIRSVCLGLEAADSATTTRAEWSHVRELRVRASASARSLSPQLVGKLSEQNDE
jgi:hypothetical protein